MTYFILNALVLDTCLVSETKELNLKVHDANAFGCYITYSRIIHQSSNLFPLPSADNPETSTENRDYKIFYIPRLGNGNTW